VTKAGTLVLIGLLAAWALGAQTPAGSLASRSRFVGCYQVRLGPWTNPPMLAPPFEFRLDSTASTSALFFSGGFSSVVPSNLTGRETAGWRIENDSTISIHWSTGFVGVSLKLRVDGDTLRGKATSGADTFPSDNSAPVTVWRVACRT
jgi:hypothetical protein